MGLKTTKGKCSHSIHLLTPAVSWTVVKIGESILRRHPCRRRPFSVLGDLRLTNPSASKQSYQQIDVLSFRISFLSEVSAPSGRNPFWIVFLRRGAQPIRTSSPTKIPP